MMPLTGVPIEFILFGLTLAAVAAFHRHALLSALTGLAAVVAWKLGVSGFADGPGLTGLAHHFAHEWVTLANLLALLLSFALLARHFEESRVPQVLPALLPDGWQGGFVLLGAIFVLSAVLDNIAAALIGATMAKAAFRNRLHTGYVAAIVAAANAGGAGSVVGDTTTTMMWIAGVGPLVLLNAYIAAIPALIVLGIPASRQQHRFAPIEKNAAAGVAIDWMQLAVVVIILAVAIAANVSANMYAPALLDQLPVLGIAVALAVLATALLRRPDWSVLPEAAKGAGFLLALVAAASLMPVEKLPAPSMAVTFGLGALSAVFDNIPLTALALKQGGFDWGMLAYAVGFGGSMVWFGSSAGVAITALFPQARSVGGWLKAAWYVPLGYIVGFATLAILHGWRP